ncbi:unnamed protein product [Rhizophagus irregularis]|nr:unnamed protein product [Rhizophagus irregularis]
MSTIFFNLKIAILILRVSIIKLCLYSYLNGTANTNFRNGIANQSKNDLIEDLVAKWCNKIIMMSSSHLQMVMSFAQHGQISQET